MSVPSKIALSMAVAVSSAIIGYVHYKQSADRLKLHEGVIRDIEQQQRRKHENTYALQQQIDMTKQLKTMELSSAETPPTKQQNLSEQQSTTQTTATNLRPIKESTGIDVQVQSGESLQQLQETPADNANANPEAPSHRRDTV